MIGLACLPFGDVEAAAKEVHRVAKMGVKGVELSCSWDMKPMWHPSWDPLWQAINETQLPLHFHTFPSVDPKLRAEVKGESLLALRYSSICLFQMTLGNILTALVGAAVFERYPEFPCRVRRERHRLDTLRARPHGLRVSGPVPRH